MPAAGKPVALTLRTYKVGFGDCFLLSFRYPTFERHVLIDFGTTGTGDDEAATLLLRIAEDIRTVSHGKLHAVVATHRHKDHISGFATKKNGKGPGDIIAALAPDVVIQPWTEDPRAALDATRATATQQEGKAFAASLASMQSFAANLVAGLPSLRTTLSPAACKRLAFLGEDNIANLPAIRNLQSMGRRNYFVNCGSPCGLEALLPGVSVHVLGPPTLEQSQQIRRQRTADAAEFWHLQARASAPAAESAPLLFPAAATYAARSRPPQARWFIKKMQRLRAEQLLSIVRALDEAINNTSVILLFEAGGKRFLFSGDAQIENWSYALSKPAIRELLAGVELYKVGHHGSLNATPKSLWNLFRHRGPANAPDRLTTVVSTLAGKHGDARSGTEVPRKKLVEALRLDSDYHSTQDIKGKGRISEEIVISLEKQEHA